MFVHSGIYVSQLINSALSTLLIWGVTPTARDNYYSLERVVWLPFLRSNVKKMWHKFISLPRKCTRIRNFLLQPLFWALHLLI